MFRNAITRKPGNDFAAGLTTAGLGAPDFALALEQHGRYVALLKELGVDVEVLPALEGYPDAVFVEDTAVVVEEAAVITRPGAPSRVGETNTIEKALGKYKKILHLDDPKATIDGGDVLLMGNDFYVGLSERTNAAGVDALRKALAPYHRYTVTGVPVGAGLHLKSAVTQIGDDMIIIAENLASDPAFNRYKKIIISKDEEYGANALLINGTVIMSAGQPNAVKACEEAGCKVIVINMSEYRKMDGALTCLSLRF